jgi:hypothetical protein
VKSKEHGKIHDDANYNYSGSHAGQRRGEFLIAVSRLDERTAEENAQKRRQET